MSQYSGCPNPHCTDITPGKTIYWCANCKTGICNSCGTGHPWSGVTCSVCGKRCTHVMGKIVRS